MGLLGKIGNQLGVNLLGVDFDAQKRRQAQQEAIQRAALMAAGLIGPAPGEIRAAQIGNGEGQDISAAFAPQMEQGPPRQRSPAEVAAGLARLTASTPGFNPKPYVDLAQYSRPNLMVTPSGEAINQYDPSNAGRVFPKMGEGVAMTPEGAVMVPGYAAAAARIEGAKTRAQEGGKAAYDVITMNMPDGSTQQVPRDVAVEALLRSMTGGSGTGLGRSQTPADKVRSEGEAKTQVERSAAQPQQFSGLQDQARTTDLVISTIDKVLPRIDALTSGPGSLLTKVPMTGARDLKADLDTIRANVGFEQLAKMRAQSPTGGALGQVSERENALLQSVLGALDQGQSPDQLKARLSQIRDQLSALRSQREDLYLSTYGGAPAGPQAKTMPRTTGFNSRILSVGE